MKISIITVTLNSDNTLTDTLNSILSQNYKNTEHIIVDGGSTDNTLKILKNYPNKNKKIFIKKKFGIYKSINFAISKSSGKFICILNSDDIFQSNDTIKNLVKKISKNKKIDIFLGNVAYFADSNYYKVNRYYSSKNFSQWKMKFGLMPPHPASLIRKSIYYKYGNYAEDFKIAADFELFLRFLFIHKIRFKKLNEIIVRMRSGGISGKNIYSYWISTMEILKSFKMNNLNSNIFFIIMRIPVKINQLFFFNTKKINQKFRLFKIIFDKNIYNETSFKIFKKLQILPSGNFILSGMNLAFLGYFANREVYPHKLLYHWPDGIWIKNLININKVPGRELIEKIKLTKDIKKILILGNMSQNSKKFLTRKFKVEIKHQNLPFGNIDKIIKTKIKLFKNTLTLITLPTPKQEKLAYYLMKKNKHFKIICIGASIAIASGDEKPVPTKLKNYEFLWRLRSDFFRRLKRIFETLYFYCKGKYILNIYNKIRFIIID